MNVAQVLVTSLVWGAELGVIALGLSLSYAILRFTNFAHVEFVTVGAYLAWVFTRANIPLLPAALLSMITTGCLAILIDLAVFRHLRTASAGGKLIASVGVALLLRTVIQLIFGVFPSVFPTIGGVLPPLGVIRITILQALVIILALVSVLLLHLALRRTVIGIALRAAADNFALATARGIPGELMISFMWFLSGMFAAFGGILLAMETQLSPILGQSITMHAFAAASVGGLGSPFGAVAGALLLSFAQNVLLSLDFGQVLGGPSWRLSVNYKDGIALFIPVCAILIRPRGLLSPRTSRR